MTQPSLTADGHRNKGNGDRGWVVVVRNRSEKETDALYSSEHTSYIKRSRRRGTRNYYLIEKYLYTSAPPFSEGTLYRQTAVCGVPEESAASSLSHGVRK